MASAAPESRRPAAIAPTGQSAILSTGTFPTLPVGGLPTHVISRLLTLSDPKSPPAVSAQGGQALVAAERAGQTDQDGRPSGAARPVVDLSVIRGVGSSTVVPGSAGSYRPVIAGAKLRENATTILPRGRARSRESACLQCAFTPLAGSRRRQRRTRSMVHGKNRIPCWIDRRLTGLAGLESDATISFGLPFEREDSQYGKYRLIVLKWYNTSDPDCRNSLLPGSLLPRERAHTRHRGDRASGSRDGGPFPVADLHSRRRGHHRGQSPVHS